MKAPDSPSDRFSVPGVGKSRTLTTENAAALVATTGATTTSKTSTGSSHRNLTRWLRTAAGASVVSYAVNLAILPFVLHRVGTELFGAWATMASVLAVGALADAGVRTEVIRRVGAATGEGDEGGAATAVHQGVTLLAGLTIVIVAVGAVAAPIIRAFAFPNGIPGYGSGEIELLLRLTIVVLGLTLVGNAYLGVLRGVQRGDAENLAQMVAVPAAAAVTIAGVVAGWGLWALFAGSVAQLVATLGLGWWAARRLVPFLHPRLVRLSRSAAKGYLALSGLALLSQVSDVVDSQWDKVVLSHFVGSAAVTSFQVGTSLVLQAKALALLPLAPLLVAIAELRLRDPERMAVLERRLAGSGMVLASVALGAVAVFAPAFVRLWLGPQAAAGGTAGTAARLFVVAVAANLISAPLAYRAFGEGWHVLAATGSAVNIVVNGGASLVLTIAIGFNGALFGSIAGNVAGTVVFFVLMRRRLGARWSAPPLRAAIVGTLAALAAITLGLGRVGNWPILIFAAAAYTAIVGFVAMKAEGLSWSALAGRPS